MTTTTYIGISDLDERFAQAEEYVNERCNPAREIGTTHESEYFDDHLPDGWILLPSRDWYINYAVWINKAEHKVLFLNRRALALVTARDAITWDAELDACFHDFQRPEEEDDRFDYVDRNLLYEDPDRQVRVDVVFTDADHTQSATVLSAQLEEYTWLSVWFAEGSEYADTLKRWTPESILLDLFLNARTAVHQRFQRGLDPRAYGVVRIDERGTLFESQLRLRFGPTGLEIAKVRAQLEQHLRRLPDASDDEKAEIDHKIKVLKTFAEILLDTPQPFDGDRPVFRRPEEARRIAEQLADEGRA